MSPNVNNSSTNVMQVIQSTPPAQIAELDFVRDRYIQNYNACHREKVGELMYHRQVIHFKQILMNSEDLRGCDPFSLYACFATAAVNGYSMDPADDEVYLIPRGGKAYLQKQAGAYVRRLIRTNQIQFAEQAKLVYQGDEFEVINGRVLKHVERFASDIMIAGYVRMVIDDKGQDRYFIYRKSDWQHWRSKSPQKNGGNWVGPNEQPVPGFLRTKIVLHACKEKCWAIGQTPPSIEQFEDVEIDVLDDDPKTALPGSQAQTPATNTPPGPNATTGNTGNNGNFFAGDQQAQKGVTVDDGTF